MAGLVPIIPDEEEEQVEIHTLQITGPVLPADYPLFDWDPYWKCRNALIPGGATRNFKTNTWNAIISTFFEAVYTAGFSFYNADKGFGEEDLLMIDGRRFGTLTAARMNAVVAAFDNFLPWPWIWKFEREPPYPESSYQYPEGLWWKSRFYGIDNKYGFEPSVVYPEYILGLARRVNLFIELMRGTYPVVEFSDASCIAKMKSANPGMRAGRSARIRRGYIINVIVGSSPVVQRQAFPIELLTIQSSLFNPDLISATAAVVNRFYEIKIPIKAGGSVCTASIVKPNKASFRVLAKSSLEKVRLARSTSSSVSNSKASIQFSRLPPVSSGFSLNFKSLTQASMDRLLLTDTKSKILMKTSGRALVSTASLNPARVNRISLSKTRAAADIVFTIDTTSKARTFFFADAQAVSHRGLEIHETQQGSQTHFDLEAVCSLATDTGTTQRVLSATSLVELVKTRVKWVWPEQLSQITTYVDVQFKESTQIEPHHVSSYTSSIEIVRNRPFGVESEQASKATCKASLDTAWLPPVWVNGGLWIRQAHTIVHREDGSLEVH